MAERDALIGAFLAANGWQEAKRTPMGGDASLRRWERLSDGKRRALLMDAPPADDVRPYIAIANHLRALGFSAPRIFAAEVAAGLLVIEDFGDDTYTRLLANGADETSLYALAVDVLIELHRKPPAAAIPPGLPCYDDARLLAEAGLLVEWYVPAVAGARLGRAAERRYFGLWRELLPLARNVPETLVLRDYHVDNLMWLPRRKGVRACGLLDFQGALAGPVSYDLVSLLEDARRDVRRGLAREMKARYLALFPDLDRAAFTASAAILAAQRNAKIIGIFTRLCVRDGKPAYLAHIPRLWRLLQRDLAHPVLAPVSGWFERHIPPAMRRIPNCRVPA